MQTTQRRIDPGLIEQLLDTPWRFEFFQAVRVLEHCFERTARDAGALAAEIRFSNSVKLGFAPSQLESVTALRAPDAEPGDGTRLDRVEITPSFIGLLGGLGALPASYTEHVIEHERDRRNPVPRAFFDLFTQRAVAQFYLAWRKHKPAFLYEMDRRQHFLPQVLALCGLGHPGLRDRLADDPGAIDDEALAYFAALLRQRPVSAVAVQRVLASYFRVPVRLEQFVGKWYPVPAAQRSALGRANTGLGADTVLGERVWQSDLRVRILIGPLARARFEAFLPGSAQAAALGKLLALLSGAQVEYEVRLILRALDVLPCQLGAQSRPRLGFNSFLCSRPALADRCDAGFEIHPSP